MTNHMFAVRGHESITNHVNVVMEYKGFFISIAFDNGFNNSLEHLSRTEMLITKDNKTVTHKFFECLKNVVDEGDDPLDTISNITLDTLTYIKAAIDCGKVR